MLEKKSRKDGKLKDNTDNFKITISIFMRLFIISQNSWYSKEEYKSRAFKQWWVFTIVPVDNLVMEVLEGMMAHNYNRKLPLLLKGMHEWYFCSTTLHELWMTFISSCIAENDYQAFKELFNEVEAFKAHTKYRKECIPNVNLSWFPMKFWNTVDVVLYE